MDTVGTYGHGIDGELVRAAKLVDVAFNRVLKKSGLKSGLRLKRKGPETQWFQGFFVVRSTGLEPVLLSEHAPQTCAYADSATTA
jgi:hypothetical protein